MVAGRFGTIWPRLLAPCLLLALGISCRGAGQSPPPPEEPRLPTFAELVERAFPGVALESVPGQGLSLAADHRWRLTALPPPLEGQPWGLLAFFALEGPDGLAPGLGLPSGTYAVAADASAYFLTADGARLLPLPRMRGGQGARPAPPGSARPLLAVDADGDGRHEFALAWQEGHAPPSYRLYWRQSEGWGLSPGQPTPAQAALDYWAAVGAALDRASLWTPPQRQRLVWPWLADEEEGAGREKALLDLAEETGRPPEDVRGDLEAVRASLRQAWGVFSPQFQQRQTWPGFINAFRFTEAAQLEALSPPRFLEKGRALLEGVVSLRQREGEDVVWRRFRVTFRLQEAEDGRWLLDDVDALELR